MRDNQHEEAEVNQTEPKIARWLTMAPRLASKEALVTPYNIHHGCSQAKLSTGASLLVYITEQEY